MTDFILFMLSTFIAVHLLILHTAPWVLIAIYWAINALRNILKATDIKGGINE